jgi:uncharacterized protein (DUF58 family)
MNDIDHITPSIFFTVPAVLCTGLLLLLSLGYGQYDVSVFSLLLLALYAGIRIWSIFSPRGITCHCFTNRKRLFPGESARFRIRVHNNKYLPVFVRIKPAIHPFLPEGKRDAVVEKESGLLWKQAVTFEHRLTAHRRGIYPAGVDGLTTGDLFGLFPQGKAVDQSLEIIVYPKIVPIRPFPLIKRILFGKPGTASPVRDPIYMLGTRQYRSFRPSRHIHWKASARLGRLQEKIFEPAEQDKVLLALDGDRFHAENAFDDFEKAIEVIASLARMLEAQKFAVGFITNCRGRNGRSTDRGFVACPIQLPVLLQHLAGIEMQPSREMTAFLDSTPNLPRDTTCVYFTHDPHRTAHRRIARAIPTVEICCASDAGAETAVSRGSMYHLSDFLI